MAAARCRSARAEWSSWWWPSAGLPGLLAQQARRAEDHDQHQIREDDRRRPLRVDAVVRDLLDDADDQRAQHGAAQIADAAHHRGGEGQEPALEPLEPPDRRLVERVPPPGGAGQDAADEE